MSVRVILRENNIAVHQMMMLRKTPIISVPLLKAVRVQMLNELTVNDWSQDIDEDFINTKEYEFSYQEGDTLFYDLVIKKESKKMSDRCDDKKVSRLLLLGFTSDGTPTRVDSYRTPISISSAEDVMLKVAEEAKGRYLYMKLLAVDIANNTIYCKDINFKTTTVTKATLC